MFISQGGSFSDQANPNIAGLGFINARINATSAELGVIGASSSPFARVDSGAVHNPTGSRKPIALCITASIGHDLSEIDPNNLGPATLAMKDRIYVFEPISAKWLDESYHIPSTVLASNNSGVGFGGLNGDG